MKHDLYSILRNIVISRVFVSGKNEKISTPYGEPDTWMFDFRRVMLQPEVLDIYAELFMQRNKHLYPFQVGGLEVAAIPLITAIVMKSKQLSIPVNGFFIRKSRKKSGLLRIVEGKVDTRTPIILVDDILNSGGTFVKQVEVLENFSRENGVIVVIKKIESIVRYRSIEEYAYFINKGIDVCSFFTLDEISSHLKDFVPPEPKKVISQNVFDIDWSVKMNSVNHWLVSSKGSVVFDGDKRVYFGSDSKSVYCFDAGNGNELFSYSVGYGIEKKRIFSQIILCRQMVIFGAFDGNIYAINSVTGKRIWTFFDYDHTGGDIALNEESGVIYAHVITGVFKKCSYVVALDVVTGKIKWISNIDISSKGYCQYMQERDVLVVATSNGGVYRLNTNNGKCVFFFESKTIIHSAPTFGGDGKIIVTGIIPEDEEGKTLFVLDELYGKTVFSLGENGMMPYATPLVVDDCIYVSSLNKHIYAFSVVTGKLLWNIDVGHRVFSSPRSITWKSTMESYLYVGTNGGQLLEIKKETGKIISSTIFSERIMDAVVYDEKNERIYLTTYANELYSLRRKK